MFSICMFTTNFISEQAQYAPISLALIHSGDRDIIVLVFQSREVFFLCFCFLRCSWARRVFFLNKHGVSKSSLLNSWPIGASICQPSLAHFKSFPLFDLRDYVKQS